jgi:hypothetical protein
MTQKEYKKSTRWIQELHTKHTKRKQNITQLCGYKSLLPRYAIFSLDIGYQNGPWYTVQRKSSFVFAKWNAITTTDLFLNHQNRTHYQQGLWPCTVAARPIVHAPLVFHPTHLKLLPVPTTKYNILLQFNIIAHRLKDLHRYSSHCIFAEQLH